MANTNKNNKTAAIKGGEQSKSIAFFASLTEIERLEILEAACVALRKEEVAEDMDISDEYAAKLHLKVEIFMQN